MRRPVEVKFFLFFVAQRHKLPSMEQLLSLVLLSVAILPAFAQETGPTSVEGDFSERCKAICS
jgi:hypothetical protein